MTITILHGNCLDVLKTLPDNSIHMAVTSPPYWGLRAYGTEGQTWPDGWIGELGHEPTPQLYVAHLVQIMREVRRVLRDDGVLFLNLGDSYVGGKGASSQAWSTKNQDRDTLHGSQHQIAGAGETRVLDDRAMLSATGLKPKDLVGIPWRVAFALQDDGWWLRQDIIWAKPNPMPESVTDRCTKAHEYMFLLAKSARYYYDSEAVKEPATTGMNESAKTHPKFGGNKYPNAGSDGPYSGDEYEPSGSRNRRSVWTITTKPFREAHFATFPPDLVEPCIKAGTSQHGVCATCGAPWERVVDHQNAVLELSETAKAKRDQGLATQTGGKQVSPALSITTGWRPTCTCNAAVAPAIVLDPFNGAGTTGVVAKSLGRNYVGIELNPAYVEMAQRRINKTQPPLPGTL